MPKSSQLYIETTQGDFFALWIYSLTGTEVLRGCQLDSCHCSALTDHVSSGCSPFFSAGCILQGSDLLWVESMVPFYLYCRWLPWSVELQLLCAPCHHFTAFSRDWEQVVVLSLTPVVLGGIAWCFFHIVASPGWGCFQPCSYGPALTVIIFLRNLLPSSLELAFYLFWGWSSWPLSGLPLLEELLNASHFIAVSTQHFPAAVKMPRTFLTPVRSELGWVLLVN